MSSLRARLWKPSKSNLASCPDELKEFFSQVSYRYPRIPHGVNTMICVGDSKAALLKVCRCVERYLFGKPLTNMSRSIVFSR